MAVLVNLTTPGTKWNLKTEGHTYEEFLLVLKWMAPLLVQISEVGRHTPLIWATPAGSLYEGMEGGMLFACLLPPC